LAEAHAQRGAEWAALEEMAMPAAFARGALPDAPVMLRDVSHRRRFGCKGPQAPAWLAGQGLAVPERFNHFVERDGLLIARLAATEFLLEAAAGASPALARIELALAQRLDAGGSGVYPVLRDDAAIELAGPRANELLLQTCNVNFRPLAAGARSDDGLLVMTSMVGVSVLVVPQARVGAIVYRLWCDPTFGPYLWRTLLAIVEELGGGAIPST
jgi:sarcosine oxidase subunit gamma